MKIRCTFKDPDTMPDAVNEAARTLTLDSDTIQAEIDKRADEARELIVRKWMAYSEYIVVEFDTDAGTATVIHR